MNTCFWGYSHLELRRAEKGERGGKKILIERPQINTIQKTFKTSNKSVVTTYLLLRTPARFSVSKPPSASSELPSCPFLSFAEEHRRYSVTRSCVHSRAWSQNSDCWAVSATLVDLVALCLKITFRVIVYNISLDSRVNCIHPCSPDTIFQNFLT